MKISCTIGGWKGDGNFQFLRDCGFDACEYPLGGLIGNLENTTEEEIKERCLQLNALAKEAGLIINQTHGWFGGHPGDYTLEDIIKHEIASVKATYWLGAKYIVVHPYILKGRKYDLLVEEAYQMSLELYKGLIPTLEEYGITCCIENMFAGDWEHKHMCPTICSHADEMARLCDELNELSPHFGICLDSGHGLVIGDDPSEMARELGSRIKVLHTHDNDGIDDLHTYPFSSHGSKYNFTPIRMDWHEYMRALEDIGYEGTLNFEIGYIGPKDLAFAGYSYLAEIGKYLADYRDQYAKEKAEQ